MDVRRGWRAGRLCFGMCFGKCSVLGHRRVGVGKLPFSVEINLRRLL